MSNQNSEHNAPDSMLRSWGQRLYVIRWPLLAAFGVLAYFLIIGRLGGMEALTGVAVILAVAIAAGDSSAQASSSSDERTNLPTIGGPAGVSLVDALPDPCFLLDRRAMIVHRNPAAALQFPGAGVGNPIAFSIRNPELLAAIDTVASGADAQSVELHQTVPSATWFKVHVAPLDFAESRLATGELHGWIVVTMQSLTEQKRIEAMRADFIANASHELRTPLTSLTGFIDTLQGPAASDKKAQEKFLGIMRLQAQRMSNLIDDLLSLSRIEMRQHVRPTDSVDVSLILSEVVEGLQTQATDADVEVELTLPNEKVEVIGDRDELYEVFENLVDNAIKYGAAGKSVLVSVEPADRPGFDYKISVADKGAGIAEEHVPRLTERFYRVDAESSRKKKGTGLGLAIVKHILNRHGGQFIIRSRLGEGTRVDIFLSK